MANNDNVGAGAATPDFTKAWIAGYHAGVQEVREVGTGADIFGLLICATVDSSTLAPEYPELLVTLNPTATALRRSWFDGRSTALRAYLTTRAEASL